MACSSTVSYKESLDTITRKRYEDKLNLINGVDPYDNNVWSTDVDQLPTIEQEDIYEYLVYKVSFYTREQFKASKQLGAHNQLTSGWVKSIMSHKPKKSENIIIIISEVHHSQSLSEKPLKPWVISQVDGTILTAHCDCMAGLAESCTHVAALLFAVNVTVKIRDSKTPTQMPAAWLVPPKKDIIFSEASNIDFSSSLLKKREMDSLIFGKPCQKKSKRNATQVTAPSNAELDEFFSSIQSSVSGIKPCILSVIPQYQAEYVPFSSLPMAMTVLYSEHFKTENLKTIVEHCEQVFDQISVSQEEASNAETKTRQQLNSKLWVSLRTGRITASVAHQVCHTSLEKPSLSLILKICRPASELQIAATQWGKDHEKDALRYYSDEMKSTHLDFTLEKCGIFINPLAPHLAASPDGIATCSCHGTGCVEVKCPSSKATMSITECCEDPNFCLFKEGENFVLKKTHPYYYQVQLQMFVTGKNYCDFGVWTTKQMVYVRIVPDTDFINMMVSKLHNFFLKVVLPELVGHYFSCPDGRKPNTLDTSYDVDVTTTPTCFVAVDGTTTTTHFVAVDGTTTPTHFVAVDGNTIQTRFVAVDGTTTPAHFVAVNTTIVDAPDATIVDAAASHAIDTVTTPVHVAPTTVVHTGAATPADPLYCYCKRTEDVDDMVACDNAECKIEWFHFFCVGIKNNPKGKWFCPECRQLPQFSKQKQNKAK